MCVGNVPSRSKAARLATVPILRYLSVNEPRLRSLRASTIGEEVWAAVVLKGDSDAERLQAFCRTRLADFKVPKVIRIASALPKNETGKIERRALAALFARQR